jgi:hypothetical protein
MKKSSITIITVILMASMALCSTVKADTAVSVYIMDPTNPANGGKGLSSGGYWVGQIPITITAGSSTQTLSYCINFDRGLSVGSTYSATIAPAADTAEWRSVSYVLTWNSPTTNSEAAADQVAVWRLLNQTRGTDYFRESWLDAAIDSAGNAVANQAVGKDVVRQGDLFSWVSPSATNMSAVQANPGQTLTFVSLLTSSAGTPRANVNVLYNATLTSGSTVTLLNSTYVSASSVLTDSNGRTQITVKVPADTAPGATIAVEAATKGVWPQHYIDLANPSTQNLLGMGDAFQLTLKTNLCIYAFITVLPESPVGPIMAIGAVGAGFAAYVKVKQKRAVKQ